MNYEVQLIACCLLDNSIIDIATSTGVQPEWFSGQYNQQVWTASVERHSEGKTVDIVWADNYYQTLSGSTELIYTDATHDVLVSRSEALSAIEIMKQNYLRKQLIGISTNINRKLNSEDPDILINETTKKLEQLKQNDNEESVEAIEEKIIAQLNRGIEYPTGFHQLDYLVKGIEPGVLWVIGAHTSNGKTTFALNLAYNLAKNAQPVTFFSTEMLPTLLYKRINTMLSGINPSISPSITEEEKEAYINELPTTLNLPIKMYSTLSLPKIRMTVRKRESKLYVVDYIQMIHPGIKVDSEVKRLGFVVRELERLTKEYEVCIIATSQFRRSNGDDPTLSSYRGSGEIEENTDIGILMFYPYQQASLANQQVLKETGKDKIINIGVQKNRIHGLTGKIQFEFDPRTMRMKELDKDT